VTQWRNAKSHRMKITPHQIFVACLSVFSFLVLLACALLIVDAVK